MTSRNMLFAGALLMLSVSASSEAQQAVQVPPPVTEILTRMRQTGTHWMPMEVLRDAGWTSSPRYKDELADSLVLEALKLDANQFPTANAMLAAEALGRSGALAGPGAPFRGAAQRQLAIAIAGNAGQAAVAAHWLSEFHDRRVGVRMLGELAASPDNKSITAVRVLTEKLGPDGVAELRRAFESGALRNPLAKSAAAERASRGWQSPR